VASTSTLFCIAHLDSETFVFINLAVEYRPVVIFICVSLLPPNLQVYWE